MSRKDFPFNILFHNGNILILRRIWGEVEILENTGESRYNYKVIKKYKLHKDGTDNKDR